MDTASILNHLIFHKSLIHENGTEQRIERYLRIIEDMESGLIIGIKDPLERTIATVFELVIEQKFDPWDINISEFTKMYLKRVKKEDYVDFVTAGRLILLAWSVLKLQSDKVLLDTQPPEPAQENWIQEMEIYDSPEDLDFTHSIVSSDMPPIHEIIRKKPSRPVTLIELVNAFDDALKDASRMRLREPGKRIRAPNFHQNVHKENLNEDLELAWKRILEFNGSAIPLHNLCTNDSWDIVTIFTAVLFLAHMKKIKLWQRNFPRGEIFVKSLDHSKELSFTELMGDETEQKLMEEKVEA